MKKLFNYSTMIVSFTALWVILNEKAGPIQLITGAILSIISISFTNTYLLHGDYTPSYYIKTNILIKYLIYLIIQIYKSGFSSINNIIQGQDAVKIVEYDTCIEDDLSICLLANAITLTPGTVTIDKTGNKLIILCFSGNEEYTNTSNRRVCSKFEEILRGRR